jgi:hypothetical protein
MSNDPKSVFDPKAFLARLLLLLANFGQEGEPQPLLADINQETLADMIGAKRFRRHVKRLLREYGYPPDLQDAAVVNVLQQAEALSAEWAT